MIRHRTVPCTLLAVVLISGCLTSKSARILKRLEGQYLTGQPSSPGWKAVNPGSADNAWWNHELGATIYTDSNCATQFANDWLTMLMDNLFLGIRHSEDIEERWLEIDGAQAFYRARRGLADDALVEVGAVVFKKGDCAYDAVLISSPEAFDAGLSAFWEVANGIDGTGARP